jgi:hypothetical protein
MDYLSTGIGPPYFAITPWTFHVFILGFLVSCLDLDLN